MEGLQPPMIRKIGESEKQDEGRKGVCFEDREQRRGSGNQAASGHGDGRSARNGA